MYLYSRRVDVLLGVDHSEKHFHKAFGLILKKHIHLADHGFLELVHRLVLLDQGQDVLGQSCRVCIAAERDKVSLISSMGKGIKLLQWLQMGGEPAFELLLLLDQHLVVIVFVLRSKNVLFRLL